MAAVSIYIPQIDRVRGAPYSLAAGRVGARIVGLPPGDAVLPLSDVGAYAVAGHPRFMPLDSLDIVLRRDRLHETGLATLPTTRIASPEDVPNGMFAKINNSAKPSDGLVMQPHLGFPQTDLDVSFSVGPDGSVRAFAVMHLTHLDAKQPGNTQMAEAGDVAWAVDALAGACDHLGIRGGIHNVQFLWYEDKWCVIDWNPRPAFVHTEGLAAMGDYMDRALAHMLGRPIPEGQDPVFETRGYWDKPVPAAFEPELRRIGLLPRRKAGQLHFNRVSGVGTPDELAAKFNQLENLL